ncbi:MAG: hypothetical protein WD532_06000 [Acidimicrobiia bacterium]
MIVTNDATVHSGLLVTGAGEGLDIDVELIGGRTLRMSAAGGELGTWPIEECRIDADPAGDGSFRIVVDGDDAVFTPVDPEGFSSLVAIIKERGVGSDSDDHSSPPPSAVPTTDAESADDPVAFPFTPAALPISHADPAAFDNRDDADERPSQARLLAEEYVPGPNTVAEDALFAQRSLRGYQVKDAKRSQRMKIAGLIAGVAAVVALFAFVTPLAIEFIQNYESEARPPTTLPVSEATVAPSTTIAEDVTATTSPPAPVGDVIFDQPSSEFVAAWDAAGGPVDQVLEFDANPVLGPFEERFTPFLSLVSVVQPDGTLDEFALDIDPSGPAEYDRVGIQALGVAIATVEPDRTPQQRASLLGELGLDVRQPLLEGINGTVESGGILYTLVYDESTALLTLTVAPAN